MDIIGDIYYMQILCIFTIFNKINASIICIINSIVDNLTKQNLMYSLVVSYKVKLHMYALHIFMILCIVYTKMW